MRRAQAGIIDAAQRSNQRARTAAAMQDTRKAPSSSDAGAAVVSPAAGTCAGGVTSEAVQARRSSMADETSTALQHSRTSCVVASVKARSASSTLLRVRTSPAHT